jgi:hypothetical protein
VNWEVCSVSRKRTVKSHWEHKNIFFWIRNPTSYILPCAYSTRSFSGKFNLLRRSVNVYIWKIGMLEVDNLGIISKQPWLYSGWLLISSSVGRLMSVSRSSMPISRGHTRTRIYIQDRVSSSRCCGSKMIIFGYGSGFGNNFGSVFETGMLLKQVTDY